MADNWVTLFDRVNVRALSASSAFARMIETSMGPMLLIGQTFDGLPIYLPASDPRRFVYDARSGALTELPRSLPLSDI